MIELESGELTGSQAVGDDAVKATPPDDGRIRGIKLSRSFVRSVGRSQSLSLSPSLL